jgi:branched-chain amino acid transport system permease protein
MTSPWRTALPWVGGFVLFALFITFNKGFSTFVQYFLLGLPQGAVIALIAVGYTMVYGIIQLINFAHGEVFMFAAYFVLMLITPADPGSKVAVPVIVASLAFLFACSAWVALGRVASRPLRAGIALAVAAAGATANWWMLPRPGGAVVVPFFAAYALAVIYTCCLGVTMDLVAYKPLRASPRLIPLITAIGLSLFLQNCAQAIWGSASRVLPRDQVPEFLGGSRGLAPGEMSHSTVVLPGGFRMQLLDIIIIVLAVVLMLGLQAFILRSRTGRAMRACAQDRVTASLMGVRVSSVVAVAFALGAGLAALVAPLYVLRGTPIAPQMGYIVGILAFASAVLGGIGNITGAMLGGMVIGIITTFVPLFDSLDTFAWFQAAERSGLVTKAGWDHFTAGYGKPGQYLLGVAYAFMILVIVFKPTGLLGKASAKRA